MRIKSHSNPDFQIVWCRYFILRATDIGKGHAFQANGRLVLKQIALATLAITRGKLREIPTNFPNAARDLPQCCPVSSSSVSQQLPGRTGWSHGPSSPPRAIILIADQCI